MTLSDWAFANPVYAAAFLLGIILGTFYGFDGWRGSPQETDISESPRVRGLIWVLTVALTTVIGDIHSLDADAKKPIVLLLYIVGVAIGAIVVVVGWGAFVAISHFRSSISGDYPFAQAFGDYLFYGYRYYDRERASKDRLRKLHAQYFQQVAYTIAAVRPQLTNSQQCEIARRILGIITTVVRKYHGDDGLPIRSNLMRVRTCANGDALYQRLKFVDGTSTDIKKCLELITYEEEGAVDLVLPIPPIVASDKALPGAPLAFVRRTAEIVDDTSAIVFPAGLPDAVRDSQKRYFAEQSFRSFASLCVVANGQVVGVANIESDSTHVFGRTKEDKESLAKYLLPFCSAFGILFSS